MFKTALLTAAMLSIASLAMAQQADPPADELTELRADYAQLKLQHDEAMAELRELKAALQQQVGQAETAEADPAPRPQLTDEEAAALLKRISDHQAKLETQVDTLIARQRELDAKVAASKPAPTQAQPTTRAYTQTIESPYAYRYERTEERIVRNPAADTDKPVIVSPKYTVYSNGYSTDSYVLPTKPARTVAEPVYVNNNYFYHGTVYPGYRTYHKTYGHYPTYDRYPTFYSRRYYRPGGLTVGVYNGKTFFRYSTGSFYHHSRRHCP